jgi:hypothetical protein
LRSHSRGSETGRGLVAEEQVDAGLLREYLIDRTVGLVEMSLDLRREVRPVAKRPRRVFLDLTRRDPRLLQS